jgi:7,8-dihydropterin-6-yl-methyl-4-(beta-D-ribofuranosyl)aminobenzene 5'-phosphate synthase
MTAPGSGPLPLDDLTITIVIDNTTDTLSSIQPGVPELPEMAYLLGQPPTGEHDGHRCVVTLNQLCFACHGFSALVSARRDESSATVLFDVGPDAGVWLANAAKLRVDLAGIDVLFLSHWHWDHSGGIPLVVAAITAARREAGQPPLVVDLPPDRPDQRGILTPFGVFAMLPPEPTLAAIEAAGGTLSYQPGQHSVASGLLLSSGEIPRRTSYETGFPGHHSWRQGVVSLDEEIREERVLLATVRGRGTTVLSACSHAGVVNVGLEAQRLVPHQPLDLLLGGYHLAGAAVEDRIEPTVSDLAKTVAPRIVAPGHCTGWRALAALAAAPGEMLVAPSVVGARFLLEAPR